MTILRKGGGGVSENPKFPHQKKLRFFGYFFQRGGVSPIPKGCYHKNWGFLDIIAKWGGLTQFIGFLS